MNQRFSLYHRKMHECNIANHFVRKCASITFILLVNTISRERESEMCRERIITTIVWGKNSTVGRKNIVRYFLLSRKKIQLRSYSVA